VGRPSKPRLTQGLAGDLSSSEGTIPDTRAGLIALVDQKLPETMGDVLEAAETVDRY